MRAAKHAALAFRRCKQKKSGLMACQDGMGRICLPALKAAGLQALSRKSTTLAEASAVVSSWRQQADRTFSYHR